MSHCIMESIDMALYLATANQDEETNTMSLFELILDVVRYQVGLLLLIDMFEHCDHGCDIEHAGSS